MERSTDITVRMAVGNFARGYMTAHNMYNKAQITGDLPDSTVALWMEKFCRETPLSDITVGVVRMSLDLGGTKRR